MEEQDGKPFDPADCLIRAVPDVICGVTFKEESDTTNPDLNKLLKLNADFVANTNDRQLAAILDFFPLAHCLPIKAYDRALQPVFQMHEIIRKLLREREETFDPTETVEDFMSALLRTKRDLQYEYEGDHRVQRSEVRAERLVFLAKDNRHNLLRTCVTRVT